MTTTEQVKIVAIVFIHLFATSVIKISYKHISFNPLAMTEGTSVFFVFESKCLLHSVFSLKFALARVSSKTTLAQVKRLRCTPAYLRMVSCHM